MSRNPFLSRRAVLSMAVMAPAFYGATQVSVAAAEPAPDASVVRASTFGFDPDDATPAINAALASGADVVVIDNVGQDWMTGPLWIERDDLTVIIESGVTMRGITAAFPDKRDGMWRSQGHKNLKLVGYGAVCQMNKAEYTGEWRAMVRLGDCENVTVEGLVLRGAPGDGIIIAGGAEPGGRSTNITVRNVVCDANKRNAISVISVDGLLIEGTAMINTEGTAPESGIDLEPDRSDQVIKNVVVRDCVFAGNKKWGFQTNFMRLNAPDSQSVSVLVERCYMGPTETAVVHVQPGKGGAHGGSIVFRDCMFDAGGSTGTVNVYRQSAYTGESTTFERVAFTAMGNPDRTDPYVKIWSGLIPPNVLPEYGNVRFVDTVLLADFAGPFIAGVEGPGDPLLANVTGSVWAISPRHPVIETTGAARDVDIDIRPDSGNDRVVLAAHGHLVRRGGNADVQVIRLGPSAARPVALRYQLSGSAHHRADYDGLSGVVVIAPGRRQASIPIRTHAHASAPSEVIITLQPLDGARVEGGSRARVRII